MPISGDAFLQFSHISKQFPGVKALDDINFSVNEGSVRALIGENGAGKSTLLKILSGAHTPTSGQLFMDGEPRVFTNTSDALAAGVAVIYQELHLANEMTVAENIFLGHMPSAAGGIVDRSTLNERAQKLLDRLGETFSPRAKLGRLPIAQRQMVEIAKALSRGAKVIAFDEPTSSLSRREIEKLFQVIADLKSEGKVILYVSHRMEEIFEICDSVTVFRDGQHVETFGTMDGVTHDILVNRMVGRDITNVYNYSPREHGEPALEVEGMLGPGVREAATFKVRAGEILGMFGLVGAGRTELLKLIYGGERKTAGSIKIFGEPVDIRSPRDSIRKGLVLCPEDRKKEGVIPIRSVAENLNLSARRNNGALINFGWERRNSEEKSAQLAVKTPSPRQLIMNLSGGNQQKVILARWLSEKVRVILLDEPTRGIDVGAKSEIYNIMYRLASDGIGVIFVSSDLPEVMGASDRLLVMREGAVSAKFERENYSSEAILKAALPITSEETA